MFRLGEDPVAGVEIFLIDLDGINVPVLVEGDWSPVVNLSWRIVHRSGLEHPRTVENVDTGSHGAPETTSNIWCLVLHL